MSVALTTPPSTTTPAAVIVDERRVTQRSVVIAEWIKFRSVRSTVIALASAGVVLVVIGLLRMVGCASGDPPIDRDLGGVTVPAGFEVTSSRTGSTARMVTA